MKNSASKGRFSWATPHNADYRYYWYMDIFSNKAQWDSLVFIKIVQVVVLHKPLHSYSVFIAHFCISPLQKVLCNRVATNSEAHLQLKFLSIYSTGAGSAQCCQVNRGQDIITDNDTAKF